MKRILKFPILYLVLLWLIFASPYFLKGLVPYASTYQVNFFPPWSHYPELLGPVKNNAMPDIHTQIYPWKKLTIDSYKNRQIPYWNPYSFSGNPHLANFQTAAFSPFNLLFFILPFIDAWSILVLLQPLLAGCFMYLLLREYKLSSLASLLGSVCFMYSGFLVVWMAYGTLAYAALYLPLALFLLEKSVAKNRILYVALFSLVIPLSIFSGHFQTSLYFLMFIAAYMVWIAVRERNPKFLFHSMSGFLAGLVLSLPQLMPTIQFYSNAVRSDIFITGGGIPWRYLVTTFAPDFYGNPVTRNDWYGFYAEWSSFVGVIPLVLATIALIYKKNKNVLFYAVSVIIIFILAVDSFMQGVLGSLHIPVLSTSTPSRIIVLYSFCIAVMSGFGLEIIATKMQVKPKTLTVIGIWGAVFIGIWATVLIGHPFPDDKVGIATRNMLLPTAFFLFLALLITLPFFIKRKVFVTIVCILLLLGASIDSLRFVQKWMPFDSKNLVYKETSVIEAVKKNIGYGRMFGNVGGETAVYYGISSIEGYDPLYIQRYGEFIRYARDGNFYPAERSVVKLERHGLYTNRVLDLLGVNLVFHPIADTNQSWAYPVWKDTQRFTMIYKDDKFQIFKNNEALPRALLYFDYEVLPKEKVLPRFYSKEFNIEKVVILEENPRVTKDFNKSESSAEIVTYSPNKVQIRVKTSRSGLLFLADNYYPGWKAYLTVGKEKKETKIYRANYTFRAIVVPEGSSEVTFVYTPF